MKHFSLATVGARRELLVLGHEALTGASFQRIVGSVLVLGERMDAMSLIFSAGALSILGAGAAVAGFAYEAIKAYEESDKLQDALRLTGNFAGLTENQYRAMATTIASTTHASAGTAREALTGLVETGRFSGDALASVAGAASAYAAANKLASGDVVKDFARMADGVTAWAVEHNKAHHDLSANQIEYIRQLEQTGQSEKAYIALGDALTGRWAKEGEQVGWLGRLWESLGNSIRKATSGGTLDEQIAALNQRISSGVKVLPTGEAYQMNGLDLAEAALERNRLLQQRSTEQAKSAADAAKANGENALTELSAITEKFKSRQEKAAQEIAEVNAKFNKAIELNPVLDPVSAKFDAAGYDKLIKERDAAIAQINSTLPKLKAPKIAALDDSGQRAADQLLKTYQGQLVNAG